MSEENKKLVRRWFEEVWNQQNTDAIDQMFAPEARRTDSPNRTPSRRSRKLQKRPSILSGCLSRIFTSR